MLVDRTTSRDGRTYASHAESSVPAESKTWYFAEGATHSGSNLFYVIQNQSATAADVVVRYLLDVPRTPVSKTYSVPAMGRRTIWVNAEARTDPDLGGLAAVDVSAAMTSTVPVTIERQMFVDHNGQSFAVGHGSPGAPAAAPDWFFAEGATGSFYDMWLSIANPSPAAATIQADFRIPSGEIVSRLYTVPANARTAVMVDDVDPRLADNAVSASLRSTNGVAFVAERSMRWVSAASPGGQETHTSAGTSATATEWGIAEGEVGGPGNTDTFLAISNRSTSAATARITLLFEDGTTAERVVDVPAGGRAPVSIAQEFPAADGRKFGVVVSSLGDPATDLMVEWAMYSTASGPGWIPATNALAQPLSAPSSTTRAAASAPMIAGGS